MVPVFGYRVKSEFQGLMAASGFYDRVSEVLADYVRRRESLDQAKIVARAKRAGYALSQSSVSRYLNADGMPGIEAAEALAAGLGVTPEWLAFGRGEKLASKKARDVEQLAAKLPRRVFKTVADPDLPARKKGKDA